MEITKERLAAVCKANGYYSTPELNEKLHLVGKGYMKIYPEAMIEFVGVTGCWLNDNAMSSLEGIQHLVSLRSLWVQRNFLTNITHLAAFEFLESVDLSENQVCRLAEGVFPPTLKTLLLGRNRFCDGQRDILPGLSRIINLTVLDVSHNLLEPGVENEAFLFEKLPAASLAILNAQGNPIRETIKNYHARVKERYHGICCIDDVKVMEIM